MFERLVEFKRVAGHGLVPQLYEPDEMLGNWVRVQMQQDRCRTETKIEFYRLCLVRANQWNPASLDSVGFLVVFTDDVNKQNVGGISPKEKEIYKGSYDFASEIRVPGTIFVVGTRHLEVSVFQLDAPPNSSNNSAF